ncbi:MAG: LptE family protein [Elusimicrobia bacterium]|nr:LptE family protein [Elusimicrobiota bacterium]
MKQVTFLIAAIFLAGCGGPEVVYRPYPQVLPQHIKKLAVRPFVNRTEYFGLEDRLTVKVVDEFLRNGRYPVSSEATADGVVVGEITRYILTPVQYNSAMVPTSYKLDVMLRVRFYDKAQNVYLWEEPALNGFQFFSASTLPGGITEEQARDAVWSLLAKDIIKRTVEGFGSVTSESPRSRSDVQPAPPDGK